MEWRLKQRGFEIVPMDIWHQSGTYHLVSALNLLDRHYNPSLLLTQLHSITIRSQCLLLLAVVLPLHQYVEFHPTSAKNRPGTSYIFFQVLLLSKCNFAVSWISTSSHLRICMLTHFFISDFTLKYHCSLF